MTLHIFTGREKLNHLLLRWLNLKIERPPWSVKDNEVKVRTFLLKMCSRVSTFSPDWCFTSASDQLTGWMCCTGRRSAWEPRSRSECCVPADRNPPWRKKKTHCISKHAALHSRAIGTPCYQDLGSDWPVSLRQRVIQYCPRRRGAVGVGRACIQGGVDALLHREEDHLWLVVADFFKALEQLWNFVLLYEGQLAIGQAVAVDHDLLGETVVHLRRGREAPRTQWSERFALMMNFTWWSSEVIPGCRRLVTS